MLLSTEMLPYFAGHVAPVWKFKTRSGSVAKPRARTRGYGLAVLGGSLAAAGGAVQIKTGS